MEASDAGLTQEAAPEGSAPPVDSEPTGNGFLVVCSQFEPGAIVSLFRMDSPTVIRAEGGVQVDQRVVDENAEVGFSGLIPGQRYMAAGYTRGRYEEVGATAQDPSGNVELLQPPMQASPQTLGTQQTPIVNVPAAPSENADSLGVGLPEEVTSPMLSDRAEPGDVSARADADVTPGDVEGVAPPTAPAATDSAPIDAQGTDAPAQDAPVDEPNPAAPDAGSPDSSESSGTGQANGGAIEQAAAQTPPEAVTSSTLVPGATAEPLQTPVPSVETPQETPEEGAAREAHEAEEAEAAAAAADTPTTPIGGLPLPTDVPSDTTAVPAAVEPPADTPSGAPAADVAQSSDASSPVAAVVPAAGETPAPVDPAPVVDQPQAASSQDQLVQQASDLGIANASTLSEAELRQAITEKNVTPVA